MVLFSQRSMTFEELEKELLSDIVDIDLFDPMKALSLNPRERGRIKRAVSYVGKFARPLVTALMIGSSVALSGCTLLDDAQDNIPPSIEVSEWKPFAQWKDPPGTIMPVKECFDGKSYANASYISFNVNASDEDGIKQINVNTKHETQGYWAPSGTFLDGENKKQVESELRISDLSPDGHPLEVELSLTDSKGNVSNTKYIVPFVLKPYYDDPCENEEQNRERHSCVNDDNGWTPFREESSMAAHHTNYTSTDWKLKICPIKTSGDYYVSFDFSIKAESDIREILVNTYNKTSKVSFDSTKVYPRSPDQLYEEGPLRDYRSENLRIGPLVSGTYTTSVLISYEDDLVSLNEDFRIAD